VCNQRGGLFEALSADADGIALNVVNAGESLGEIPVEVIDIATDADG
jgi:hypothetical protein